jgi:membrane protein YdbS with pleckstrin-like domain
MNIMYWAIIVLGAFVAVWMLFVVPAERRHHERKLEVIQKRLEKRQAQQEQGKGDLASESENEEEVS